MATPQRSYASDFLAGIDPTGTATFQYGMQDAKGYGAGSGARRALNTAGGVLGGAAVMPAAVGGVIGGIKGLAMGRGGLKQRLISAGKGALSGAKSPYQKLYRGVQANRALGAHQAGRALSDKQVGHLSKFVKGMDPTGLMPKGTPNAAQVRGYLQRTPDKAVSEIRRHMGGELAAGAGALGLSGIISGGSAYKQYGKGVQTQQDVDRQIHQARKTAADQAYARALRQMGFEV